MPAVDDAAVEFLQDLVDSQYIEVLGFYTLNGTTTEFLAADEKCLPLLSMLKGLKARVIIAYFDYMVIFDSTDTENYTRVITKEQVDSYINDFIERGIFIRV